MNKRIKKWIKRVVLWVIGLPVALLIVSSLIIDYCLPKETYDQVVEWFTEVLVGDKKAYDDYVLVKDQILLEHYDRALAICDSLEGRTEMPQNRLDNCRAFVYQKLNQPKVAEFYYRKSLDEYDGSDKAMPFYSQSAIKLSNLLYHKKDYEGALKVLMPVIAKVKEGNYFFMPYEELPGLYLSMGKNLVALGRYDEGERHFQEAINAYKQKASKIEIAPDFETDTSFCDLKEQVAINASMVYLRQGVLDRAAAWLDVSKETLRTLQEHCDSTHISLPLYESRLQLLEARMLLSLGRQAEAEQMFRQFMDNKEFEKGVSVMRECGDYLIEAHHWQEAIDYYQRADTLNVDAHKTTIDDISQRLVPLYQAWRGMGNQQKALMMADSICGAIDSAIVRWRNSDAMELATIYDTQGKEAQIAQKQAALTRLWWIATVIVLFLVVLSFIIYAINHRRISRLRAVQDRIESELRIASDIQMSMVPSAFPEREGLDMYASMTPAKEVGGDLYNLVSTRDHLYFCVGDVSGKGVPASLFMAQATRLFQTLAKQGLMPAEICTHMNEALSGDDNENGMFITFWVGLLDLSTGHLDYCNAGHNPPFFDGDFLTMIPNAPIGLFPGLEYEGEQIDSIKGRPLFLYTDGLNEAEDPHQQQFGEDRLLAILRSIHDENAHQVIDTLQAEVTTHRHGADPNDDLTMMCVKLQIV